MDESIMNFSNPKKIIESPITIPKPRPPPVHLQQQQQQQQQPQPQPRELFHFQQVRNANGAPAFKSTSKYAELLHVIEDLGQHIRPSYTGHRGSAEKIKHSITRARTLVKECLIETERNARQ